MGWSVCGLINRSRENEGADGYFYRARKWDLMTVPPRQLREHIVMGRAVGWVGVRPMVMERGGI